MVSSQSDVAVNMETRKSSTGPPARIAVDRRTTNGLTRAYSYAYNLDGSLYTVTHPDALVVTFTPGGAGRPISEVSGDAGYATNVHYAPNGSLCYAVQGWGTTTTLDRTFNNRFQPIRIFESGTSEPAPPQCASPTQTSDLPVDFTYSYADANGHNNGNVAQITSSDWRRTLSLTYDSLNRVATAKTGATNQPAYQGDTISIQRCWGEQFGYDPWGNLLSISSVSSLYTGCTQENLSLAVNTKNQIIGDTYDSAGNLIIAQPGNFQYTYDAENHLTATSGQTYLYDGDGKRVEKASGSPLVANKLYWYGTQDSPIIETDAAGNELYRYFSFAGLLVAREEANDWVDHYGLDALGNVRWLYSNLGAWDIIDYYPFGGERLIYSTSAGNNTRLFTGKERDSESGLDNFGARYDSSSLGRFMSPDSPSYSNHKNPQSWNLYAYALNNPVSFRDADGHEIVCANNAEQCKKDAAAATGNAEAAKRVTTNTVTTKHSFLGIHWTTSKTTIGITGDVKSFAALSPNAAKLAGLVGDSRTVTVSYDQYAKPSFWSGGVKLNGGSTSYTPSEGYDAQAFIDPSRTPGAVYDQDAVDQGIPQANTAEEFGHEVLGHIWGELLGGAPAGTRANMRDSITGEDAVRALDPTRGQKGLESHHNYNEMPPDPPKPQQ
jgi:RHS repeat-associated protein